jgi:transposase-like protein
MSVRDISDHLSELYATEIGRDTISRVTDAVLQDVTAWRTRPLETVYPIVYFDALMVKVRDDRSVQNRACYLAIGVTVEGDREVLGIWWQETEGAKFWLAVLNDLHQRGTQDVLIACVDGLTGATACATSPTRTASASPPTSSPSTARSGPRAKRSWPRPGRPSSPACRIARP